MELRNGLRESTTLAIRTCWVHLLMALADSLGGTTGGLRWAKSRDSYRRIASESCPRDSNH